MVVVGLVRGDEKIAVCDSIEHWQACRFANRIGKGSKLSAFEQEDFAIGVVSQGLLSFGYDTRSD